MSKRLTRSHAIDPPEESIDESINAIPIKKKKDARRKSYFDDPPEDDIPPVSTSRQTRSSESTSAPTSSPGFKITKRTRAAASSDDTTSKSTSTSTSTSDIRRSPRKGAVEDDIREEKIEDTRKRRKVDRGKEEELAVSATTTEPATTSTSNDAPTTSSTSTSTSTSTRTSKSKSKSKSSSKIDEVPPYPVLSISNVEYDDTLPIYQAIPSFMRELFTHELTAIRKTYADPAYASIVEDHQNIVDQYLEQVEQQYQMERERMEHTSTSIKQPETSEQRYQRIADKATSAIAEWKAVDAAWQQLKEEQKKPEPKVDATDSQLLSSSLVGELPKKISATYRNLSVTNDLRLTRLRCLRTLIESWSAYNEKVSSAIHAQRVASLPDVDDSKKLIQHMLSHALPNNIQS